MGKSLVIGDIHGCYKTLRLLIEEKICPSKADRLIILGDYIDRGPSSMEVVQYLMQLRDSGHDLVLLRGNHEEMLLRTHLAPVNMDHWMMNGAAATLHSFGIRSPRDLEEKYMLFFQSLPYYYDKEPGWFLVHAGLDFRLDNPLAGTEAMVWIRKNQITGSFLGNRILVHGHNAVSLAEIRQNVSNPGTQEINLDGGCVYSGIGGLGNLVCMELDSRELLTVPNADI